MRVLLMHPDQDFDLQRELPRHERNLTQDLELDTLLKVMAGEDAFLLDVARRALFSGIGNDLDTVLYRQEIVRDCLKNPAEVRELYGFAVEAIEGKKKFYFSILSNYPSGILHTSIEALEMFMAVLQKLKTFADRHGSQFESRGFTALLAMLQRELGDDYFASVKSHLKELRFIGGVLVSAGLGKANEGIDHVLRLPEKQHLNWFRRLFTKGPPAYTYHLADRDEAGAKALGELRDQGINLAANALAQSTDHILSFFTLLRVEMGFYVGCLNLRDKLTALGAPIAMPSPEEPGSRKHCATGLYDVCLALRMGQNPVGNALDANGKDFVIITGANQGGKSTFLRAVGLAQLMMQSGMFVAAESCSAELCSSIFTHHKREEDATMKSGKLDEELKRMSEIVDAILPGSMVLFNESFAATNEREGSEIARQIVSALVEARIKVLFVTHLYTFARGCFERGREDTLFLRAERQADSTRTFKLIEGEPLETSFGVDLYRQIFTG
jgi:DNA mismatch repair ATPase MutS